MEVHVDYFNIPELEAERAYELKVSSETLPQRGRARAGEKGGEEHTLLDFSKGSHDCKTFRTVRNFFFLGGGGQFKRQNSTGPSLQGRQSAKVSRQA